MFKQFFIVLSLFLVLSSSATVNCSLTPDIHIIEQKPEDVALFTDMKQLFFEKDNADLPAGVDPKNHKQQVVCDKAVKDHGAQVVTKKQSMVMIFQCSFLSVSKRQLILFMLQVIFMIIHRLKSFVLHLARFSLSLIFCRLIGEGSVKVVVQISY